MTDEDAAGYPPEVWQAYALALYVAVKCHDSYRAFLNAQGIARGWDLVEFAAEECN